MTAISLRLLRYANPVVRVVLRSRLHPLLSRRLLLLGYRGRRSGRAFEIPLRYAELRGGQVVVCALRPGRKLWWRSLGIDAATHVAGVENVPGTKTRPDETWPHVAVSVLLRGERLIGTASVVDGKARDEALAAYAGGSTRISRAARDAAVVVVTLSR